LSRTLRHWAAIVVALVLSVIIGWLDHNADEVQGTVALLIIADALLAFAAPRSAWVTTMIIGLGPQGAAGLSHLLAMPERFPMTPAYGGLLALVPAAIGAGIGCLVRQSFIPLRT
jgi:hypothetical protein